MDQTYSNNKMFPKHGGDVQGFAKTSGILPEHVRDFSSNINPLGLSIEMKRVYHENVSKLTHYPDPLAQNLCQCIAQRHQLDLSNVIAGNGSIALIDLAIRSIRPKRALLVEPCFNEYRRLLSLSNVDIDTINLKPENDFQFPFEEILKKLSSVDLLIIGHPNNPTGSALDRDKLRVLMIEAVKGRKFILIDEAFIDWSQDSSVIRHVQNYSTSIVVRSLTKFYALAGIRVGYACAHHAMINKMRTFQETWSCNSIAQNLAEAALCDEAFQMKCLEWFAKESNFMGESLKQISAIKVFPSKANYFLCKMLDPFMQSYFWSKMMSGGIYLRDVTDFIGLDQNYFRVALKRREENLYFLEKLGTIFNKQQSTYDRNILSVRS